MTAMASSTGRGASCSRSDNPTTSLPSRTRMTLFTSAYGRKATSNSGSGVRGRIARNASIKIWQLSGKSDEPAGSVGAGAKMSGQKLSWHSGLVHVMRFLLLQTIFSAPVLIPLILLRGAAFLARRTSLIAAVFGRGRRRRRKIRRRLAILQLGIGAFLRGIQLILRGVNCFFQREQIVASVGTVRL